MPCRNPKIEHALHFFLTVLHNGCFSRESDPKHNPVLLFQIFCYILLLRTMPPERGKLWDPERGERGWGCRCSPLQLSVLQSWVFYWGLWRPGWIELTRTHCYNIKWFTMVFYCLSWDSMHPTKLPPKFRIFPRDTGHFLVKFIVRSDWISDVWRHGIWVKNPIFSYSEHSFKCYLMITLISVWCSGQRLRNYLVLHSGTSWIVF